MARKIPDVLPAWPQSKASAGMSYEIEVVTPLFGGEVEPQVNDTSLLIRPTAIREHLQFR
jgi:CRISPR/Cas system CMR-associated protein Cmr1 (group 7 of RAMP superfamily)